MGSGGGDCGQRNCNAYKPTTFGGYALLACSYFPCGFAVGLIMTHIIGYYYLYVFGLLAEHAGHPRATFLYFIAMTSGTFCIAMVCISYLRTVLTAPGFVPSEPWARQPIVITDRDSAPTHHDHFVTTVTHKRELRYCRRCAQYKPDDAHHCSQCQRCVLRMDHHCPWVNNCVGRDNTKYFILFLCWLGFSCLYLLVQIFTAYAVLPVSFNLNKAGAHLGLFMLVIGLGIFGVFMACFGGFHLQMVLNGNSTLGEVMDHQPKSAQFREVFGSPSATWYHFFPLAPVNRRPRHRPNPHAPGHGAAAVGSVSGSPVVGSIPLPKVTKAKEDAVNQGNSNYFTPRPPFGGHATVNMDDSELGAVASPNAPLAGGSNSAGVGGGLGGGAHQTSYYTNASTNGGGGGASQRIGTTNSSSSLAGGANGSGVVDRRASSGGSGPIYR